QKKPLVIDEIEVPAPLEGQVLVQVLCSGICGSQIGEIDGVKGPDKFLPHLLGHEGTGTVIQCGRNVRTVKKGDRVVLHWRKGVGLEAVPPKYKSATLGSVNAGWVTTFNEYAVVSENRVTAIPSNFDIEAGALMGCAVTTAFGVIHNNAKLKRGESIAIFGAGGIGLNMVQAAVLAGAKPIIALDIHDNRLKLAAGLGATHCINSARADAAAEVRKIVGDQGVDVAIENTGNVKVIETAYELTAAAGRTILVGVPRKGEKASIYTLPLHFGKVLTGSHGGEARPAIDIPKYIELVRMGKLDLKPLVGKRYRLEEINEAIADMRTGAIAGRCMVIMKD
ncbi:MAG: zinc-binding dehydrogenase, partial [Planctomycetota bacterium]